METAVKNIIDSIRKLEKQVENLQRSDEIINIYVYNLPKEKNGNTTESFLELCRDLLMVTIERENIE